MTIHQQAALTIYNELLDAEATTLEIIDNTNHEDIHNTEDLYAKLEGHNERISCILADRRTNHTH